MKRRARAKPVPLPGAGPRAHMDAGAPRPRDLDEVVTYVAITNNERAREDLLDYLATLLDRPGEG